MTLLKNWLQNYRNDVLSPENIVDEPHIVKIDNTNGLPGIRLLNAPLSKAPATSIDIEHVEDPGTYYGEVPTDPSNGPASDKFMWDQKYDSGFVEFNSDAIGNRVTCSYSSKGGARNWETVQYAVDENFKTKIDLASGETVAKGDFVSVYEETPGVLKGIKGSKGIQDSTSDTFNDTGISQVSSRTMQDGNIVTAYRDGITGFGEITIRSADDLTEVVAPVVFIGSAITYLDITVLQNGDIAVAYAITGSDSKITIRSKTDLSEVVAPLSYGAGALAVSIETMQDGNVVILNAASLEIRSYIDLTVVVSEIFFGPHTSETLAIMENGDILLSRSEGANSKLTTRSKVDLTEVIAPVIFSDESGVSEVSILDNGNIALLYDYSTGLKLDIRSKTTLNSVLSSPEIVAATTDRFSILVNNSDEMIIHYKDSANSNYGTVQQRSIDTIDKAENLRVFESSTVDSISSNLLLNGQYTVCFNANTIGNIIKQVSLVNLGFADEAGTDVYPVTITFAPVLDLFTALQDGSNYYVDIAGDITLDITDLFAGPSISATEIINRIGSTPTDDFGALADDVETLKSDVSTLQDDVSTNESDIAALQGSVNNSGVINTFFAHTYNGFGTTDTKIMRFLTVLDNTGNTVAYTHASTAANGDTWTFHKAGRLIMTTSTQTPTGSFVNHGISVNSTQLTTNINNISATDRKALTLTTSSTAADVVTSSANIRIQAADVVRVHSSGSIPANGAYSVVNFIFIED
jgi:hypothetical protein